MSNPLIILGAGASHDFFKLERQSDQHLLRGWTPPLTNNIFNAEHFSSIVNNYEDVKQLASAVNNLASSEDSDSFNFEDYLTELETKYPANNYGKIIALRFYLAELFSKISFHYFRPTNNHSHLLYEIQNRGLQACIVNYNYDTLLERNISSIHSSKQMDSYVSSDIKIIKMHGAHNWRFSPNLSLEKKNVYDYFVYGGKKMHDQYSARDLDPEIIRDFDFNHEGFDLNVYRQHTETLFPGGAWLYYLPALAIPIGTKGNHICPKTHIDVLVEQIKQTDRILIIGWRAQDKYLLELLKENLQRPVKLTVVSKGGLSINDYVAKFKEIKQIQLSNITYSTYGYSDFMMRKLYENFFDEEVRINES